MVMPAILDRPDDGRENQGTRQLHRTMALAWRSLGDADLAVPALARGVVLLCATMRAHDAMRAGRRPVPARLGHRSRRSCPLLWSVCLPKCPIERGLVDDMWAIK